LGLRLGLLDDVFRLLLGVFDLLLGVLTRLVERLLQRLLHTLVVLHLVFELLHLVLQAAALVFHLLPLVRNHLQEGLHLIRAVAAEALVEVLLPYVERGKFHGAGQSVGQDARKGPFLPRTPGGGGRVPNGVQSRKRNRREQLRGVYAL